MSRDFFIGQNILERHTALNGIQSGENIGLVNSQIKHWQQRFSHHVCNSAIQPVKNIVEINYKNQKSGALFCIYTKYSKYIHMYIWHIFVRFWRTTAFQQNDMNLNQHVPMQSFLFLNMNIHTCMALSYVLEIKWKLLYTKTLKRIHSQI